MSISFCSRLLSLVCLLSAPQVSVRRYLSGTMASPSSPPSFTSSLSESDPEVLAEIIDEEEDKLAKLTQRVTKCKRFISKAEAIIVPFAS